MDKSTNSFSLRFVIFAVAGGIAVHFRKRLAWIHLPGVIWAALIEFAGWICPLTPLENLLRTKGGLSGYETGLIEHYVMPVLYPVSLTRHLQIILGLMVLGINLLIYGIVFFSFYTRNKEK
ncbi:DUF2784 domain-containing protein [Thermodesulfobacteriota bacterium]